MEYTQLDKATQLNAVRNRIRDIERQYLDISLRVQAPDLQTVASEMDAPNLTKLTDSLNTLHQMESDLTKPDPTPTPPPAASSQASQSPAQQQR